MAPWPSIFRKWPLKSILLSFVELQEQGSYCNTAILQGASTARNPVLGKALFFWTSAIVWCICNSNVDSFIVKYWLLFNLVTALIEWAISRPANTCCHGIGKAGRAIKFGFTCQDSKGPLFLTLIPFLPKHPLMLL